MWEYDDQAAIAATAAAEALRAARIPPLWLPAIPVSPSRPSRPVGTDRRREPRVGKGRRRVSCPVPCHTARRLSHGRSPRHGRAGRVTVAGSGQSHGTTRNHTESHPQASGGAPGQARASPARWQGCPPRGSVAGWWPSGGRRRGPNQRRTARRRRGVPQPLHRLGAAGATPIPDSRTAQPRGRGETGQASRGVSWHPLRGRPLATRAPAAAPRGLPTERVRPGVGAAWTRPPGGGARRVERAGCLVRGRGFGRWPYATVPHGITRSETGPDLRCDSSSDAGSA